MHVKPRLTELNQLLKFKNPCQAIMERIEKLRQEVMELTKKFKELERILNQ